MKELSFILLFSSALLSGYLVEQPNSDLQDLMVQYEKECEKEIEVTVIQQGQLSYNLDGSKDTIWLSPPCPEYKEVYLNNNGSIHFGDYVTLGHYDQRWHLTDGIEREYVCKCKSRELDYFSQNFWEYVKESNK